MCFSTFFFLPTSRCQLDLNQWWYWWCLTSLGNSQCIPCSKITEIQTWIWITATDQHESWATRFNLIIPCSRGPCCVCKGSVHPLLNDATGKPTLVISCMSADIFQGYPDAVVIRKTHSEALESLGSFVLCFNSQLHKVQLLSCGAFELEGTWKGPRALRGFPDGSDSKESACNAGNPGVGKLPWRREWFPTPTFLPEEFHGQRSLVVYSPWGCKESGTTERLTLSVFTCAWRSRT